MASLKRAQFVANGDDVDVLDPASSSSRRQSNKRIRLSEEPSDDVLDGELRSTPALSVRAESVEAIAASQAVKAGEETWGEWYRRKRDEMETRASEDAEDEELGQLERSIRRRSRLANTRNLERDNGILESVTCINFMCHEHYEVKLGPLINFIVGHNGSGKSAILTAITLCLGGKASSTNRGQSLKSFIKNDKDSATLVVRIKNHQSGDSAYKHNEYGDSIIVERHFSRSGTSGFKLKAKSGKVISTKRADLDAITDYYALQLDNPVNVLTQDLARQFLSNSSAAEKYRFFIKGTQLEQLDRDYALVSDSLQSTHEQLITLRENESDLKTKMKEKRDKETRAKQQDTLMDRILSYRRQTCWAQVETQEKLLRECQNDVVQAERKIERRKEDAQAFADTFEEANQALENAQANSNLVQSEIEPLKEKRSNARVEFDDHRTALQSNQAEQRQIKTSKDSMKTQVKTLEHQIKEEKARLEAASDGGHAEKQREIHNAEDEAEQMKEQQKAHKNQFSSLEHAKEEAVARHGELRKLVDDKKKAVETAEQALERLRNNGNNLISAFQTSMPNLLKAIENDRGFTRKPVGPIGMHIRLLKPEWAYQIEKTLGSTLSAFVVTNFEDKKRLSALMHKTKCVTQIFQGRSEPLDTTPHEPALQFNTMLRILEIDDDAIRNQLIIHHQIEHTVVCDSDDEAAKLVQENTPHGIKVAVAHHPTLRGHGNRYSHGRGRMLRTDPVEALTRPPRMKTDREHQYRDAVEQVKYLKREYNDAENEAREARDKITKAEQSITQHKRQERLNLQESQRAEETIDTLRQELEEATPQDGRLDQMKSDLKEAEDQLEHLQNQSRVCNDERAQLALKDRDLKHALDDATNELQGIEDRLKTARNEIETCQNKRTQALRQKNEALAKIDDAEEAHRRAQEETEAQQAKVEEFTRLAGQYSDRVEVERGMNEDRLKMKLDQLEQQLRKAESELGGTREEIELEAKEAERKFRDARLAVHQNDRLHSAIVASIDERRTRWGEFRRYISSRAREHFMTLVAERGYKGRMSIYHDTKELELHVETDKSNRMANGNRKGTVQNRKEESAGRKTQTLSGGEKSFTTICMLLAMWEAMGSPIRCLDEFDVFMDNVNRAVSLQLILDVARWSVGRQFILITPQAMSGIANDPDIRVTRLTDPERGQTTLRFQQAA